MSEDKKVKKSTKKSVEKKKHECTCGSNGCCSDKMDTPFAALDTRAPVGTSLKDIFDKMKTQEEDSIYTNEKKDTAPEFVGNVENKKLTMDDIVRLVKDYTNSTSKTLSDVRAMLAEAEARENEDAFIELGAAVERALITYMGKSTDHAFTQYKLFTEMVDKLTNTYFKTVDAKIDQWKSAQKPLEKDVKGAVSVKMSDIFPWLDDEDDDEDEDIDDINEKDSEYIKDFDFPWHYTDKEHNIDITIDLLKMSNTEIALDLCAQYEDDDVNITCSSVTSYEPKDKLNVLWNDCLSLIKDLLNRKKEYYT